MSERYPNVLSPITIGPVQVRNRVYAAGVGLIVHSLSVPPRVRLAGPLYESSIPAFRAIAERVHQHGTKLFAQLHYVDRHSNPWDSTGGMVPTYGPTERQRWGTHSSVREIDRDEIAMLIGYYRRCARNLAEAGYDGIEVHTTHGTIHEQFLSPYFNMRTDEYGGDEEGRMRLLIETIEAVRAASRADMAIGLRLNVYELTPGGLTTDDTAGILVKPRGPLGSSDVHSSPNSPESRRSRRRTGRDGGGTRRRVAWPPGCPVREARPRRRPVEPLGRHPSARDPADERGLVRGSNVGARC
jgi:2,4-dienoyl-CoA reductase-like NADH-dependent reductase (Old Yellow Enzyme family)